MSGKRIRTPNHIRGSSQIEWIPRIYTDTGIELHLKFAPGSLLVNNGDKYHELRSIVQESGGSITSGTGHFGNGCAVFNQTRPGSGSSTDNNFVSFLHGIAPIRWSNFEFYMSVWCYISVNPGSGGYSIICCNNPRGGNTVGPELFIGPSRQIIFSTRGGIANITTSNGVAPLSTWFNIQVSRVKRPSSTDLGQIWVNGTKVGETIWISTQEFDEANFTNRFFVGATNGATDQRQALMMRGFHGSMEDLYLQIGSGTGISDLATIAVPSEFSTRPPVVFIGTDKYYRSTPLILNGNVMADQSCQSSNQTVVATGGAVITSDARFPLGVFSFPGATNSDYIDITETFDTTYAGSENIDSRQEGTIEFAFFPISKTSQFPMIIGNYTTYSTGVASLLGIHFDRDDQAGKLTVALGGGGFPNLFAPLSYGNWYDIKLQFNSNSTVDLIVNNILISSTSNFRGVGGQTGTPFKVRLGNALDTPTQSRANFKMAKFRWTRGVKRTDPSNAVLFPTSYGPTSTLVGANSSQSNSSGVGAVLLPYTFFEDNFNGTGNLESHAPDTAPPSTFYYAPVSAGVFPQLSSGAAIYPGVAGDYAFAIFSDGGPIGAGPGNALANAKEWQVDFTWNSGPVSSAASSYYAFYMFLSSNAGGLGLQITNDPSTADYALKLSIVGESTHSISPANNTTYSGTVTAATATVRVQFLGFDVTFANPQASAADEDRKPRYFYLLYGSGQKLEYLKAKTL